MHLQALHTASMCWCPLKCNAPVVLSVTLLASTLPQCNFKYCIVLNKFCQNAYCTKVILKFEYEHRKLHLEQFPLTLCTAACPIVDCALKHKGGAECQSGSRDMPGTLNH